MLTVWGRKTSSNVQAVMWCVGELGLAYERIDVGHRFGGNRTPEFLAMNPMGLVPVVRDGAGPTLFEAGAILRFLAGRYGAAPFWPPEGAARAQVDQWAEWAKINTTLAFSGPIFGALIRTPKASRDPAAIARAVDALGTLLDIAEARLACHRFLAGEDFTLADIQFGHLLFRYFDIPLDWPDRPVLRAYYEALTRRPAYSEHVMVSYDDLRADD